MVVQLGPATGAVGEVLLDLAGLVAVDGVEGVGPQELFDLAGGERCHDAPPAPASTNSTRIFLSPERMRLLTVPSGSPSRVATSR